MTGSMGTYHSDVTDVARIEEQLAHSLKQAAASVAHVDSFDEEQRAEVYAILKAMRDDSAAHRQVLGQWVTDVPVGN